MSDKALKLIGEDDDRTPLAMLPLDKVIHRISERESQRKWSGTTDENEQKASLKYPSTIKGLELATDVELRTRGLKRSTFHLTQTSHFVLVYRRLLSVWNFDGMYGSILEKANDNDFNDIYVQVKDSKSFDFLNSVKPTAPSGENTFTTVVKYREFLKEISPCLGVKPYMLFVLGSAWSLYTLHKHDPDANMRNNIIPELRHFGRFLGERYKMFSYYEDKIASRLSGNTMGIPLPQFEEIPQIPETTETGRICNPEIVK